VLDAIEEVWAVVSLDAIKVERVDVAVGSVVLHNSLSFKESPEDARRAVDEWGEEANVTPGSERKDPRSAKKDSLYSILRGSW
jgi:hypothetical protein